MAEMRGKLRWSVLATPSSRWSGRTDPHRQSGPMNDQSAQEFAARWVAAWNDHDIEAILSHYAQDIEFSSPVARTLTGHGRVNGLANLRAYWTRGLALNRHLAFHLLEVLHGEGVLTLLYENERKQRVAETLEFNASGQVIRASACYASVPNPTLNLSSPAPQVNDAQE